jgi:hypothetical protein
LSFTDPTGFQSDWGRYLQSAISLAITVYTGGLGGVQGYVAAGANGFVAGAMQSSSLKGAAWGAVSAITFHGIGSYFEGAQWAQGNFLNSGFDAGGYSAKGEPYSDSRPVAKSCRLPCTIPTTRPTTTLCARSPLAGRGQIRSTSRA